MQTIRQAIALFSALLLAVPADSNLRDIVREICLSGMIRIYSAALDAKSASSKLSLKEALLIMLQTDEGCTRKRHKTLCSSNAPNRYKQQEQ